jgi:hypothetical protein
MPEGNGTGNGNSGVSSEAAPTKENTQVAQSYGSPPGNDSDNRKDPENESAAKGQRQNDSPSGNGQKKPEGENNRNTENTTFTDLTEMGSVQNLEGLSVKIVQQTNLIEKYNKVLTENLTKLQNDAKEAVETAQTKVTKIKGLEKDAVQAIDSALKGVYSTIDGSINGLKKQVENYRHTLDPSGNILPKSGPIDESENDGVQQRTSWWQFPKRSRGGYKSTPRTRKHRKTYRFTATPKSQTMKKRHRTHKKQAKKQNKQQNKQRK